MKREKYNVRMPRERVLTRDYWELLQVAPENRVEYTNRFFYKDFVITRHTKMSKVRAYIKARHTGWKLYEHIDLETPDDTVIYRLMKVVSVAMGIEPYQGASVMETALYSPIQSHFEGVGLPVSEPFKTDYDAFGYDEFGFNDNVDQRLNAIDREDINFIDHVLKAVDKQVRDKVKGKKIYDEYELLGKEQCSIGTFSFIVKHCTQAVYRDDVCYGHWMATQDKRPGYNPALPDESLHTYKRPYIASVNRRSIVVKMKQYFEVTKPVIPAIDTPKKPRCKHLLYKDECSICLGRPSVTPDTIEGLPVETDNFMVIDY